jgi:predicted ATPase
MVEAPVPLGAVSGSLSSLGLYARRVTRSLVGRPQELAAIDQELAAAQQGLACLTVEGEPGIGKPRFLLAIEELARATGFITVGVTADEEIRGPLLLARSIFGSAALEESVSEALARQAVQRVCDALSNVDEPGLQSLAPDRRLVRIFDMAALAMRAVARERPLVLLIDDVQWADEDSLRMLRYVVRTNAAARMPLVLASRSDEIAFVPEAVSLLADVERMGLLRRLRLHRFSQLESTEFLQQVLGGQINLASAAVMHSQAEGVPFILAEQAQAYRDAGIIQQIDGTWTLSKNADRLLPSTVRTLIQRRAARMPNATQSALAEAAVLGRSFSLKDLRDIKTRLNDGAKEIESLAESLTPAVSAGLLVQHPDGSAADYSFTHKRVREYAAATLTSPRRRAIQDAIVNMLTAVGNPRSVFGHACRGRSETCPYYVIIATPTESQRAET